MKTARKLKATDEDVRRVAYDHLAQLVFDCPLAATQARIAQVVGAIGPRLLGLAGKDVELSADFGGDCLPEPDDVAITPDGVAIVPIRGTFARRAGVYEAMSGMVSYEKAVKVIQAVANDARVKGLVLAIDSPGGAVTGCPEAAAAIAAVGKKKPIYGAADGQATSAAYWLLAQCDRVFVPTSGIVASIGVYAVRLDATKYDAENGLKYTFISSGDRKGDGDPHKPLSAAEKSDLQDRIDQAAALFFRDVADARGLSVDDIAALEGACLMGQAAVEAGLADQLGTVDDAVAALTKKLNANSTRTLSFGGAAAEGRTPNMSDTVQPVTEPAATDKVVAISPDVQKQIDAKLAEQAQAKKQNDEEIVALCADFGKAELAGTFIAEGLTRRQAFEKLQAAKVQGGTEEVRGFVSPGTPQPVTTIDAAAVYAKRRAQVIEAGARRLAAVR